jgi:hypothetical protein
VTKLASMLLCVGLVGFGSGCGSSSPAAVGGSAGTGGSSSAAGSSGTGGDSGAGGTSSTGGSSGDAAVTDGPSTTTTSKLITSADGGTVMLDDMTLVIPAGALGADTTITISASSPASTLPDVGSVAGLVYNLGPDGTMFTKAVELTLPVSGTVPADKDAVCSFLDTTKGVWVDLPGSISGATIKCQTMHFTMFAVRFVGKGGTCPFGGACGGDLVGTWDITEICVPKDAPMTIGICPTDTASTLAVVGGTGALVVTGTSYTLNISATAHAVYSAACLAPTMAATCADIEAQLIKSFGGTATCTGTVTTACDCMLTVPQKAEMGTIAITGNTAKFVKQGTLEADAVAQDFCVKGTALEVKSTKTTVSDAGASTTATTVYKATKK